MQRKAVVAVVVMAVVVRSQWMNTRQDQGQGHHKDQDQDQESPSRFVNRVGLPFDTMGKQRPLARPVGRATSNHGYHPHHSHNHHHSYNHSQSHVPLAMVVGSGYRHWSLRYHSLLPPPYPGKI